MIGRRLLCFWLFWLSSGVKVVREEDLGQDAQFEYIVVGGGGAGSVVARTLSDSGAKVLLIERGRDADAEDNSIFNLPELLLANDNAQQIITTQGVRSQIGGILGGGTSVNIGIWIEENWQYFQKLNEVIGFRLVPDLGEISSAFAWLRSELASIPRQTSQTSDARNSSLLLYEEKVRQVLESHFGPFAGPSATIIPGYTWRAYSLFNSTDNFRRRSAADLVREASDNLTLLLNATVLSLDSFRTTPNSDLTATCVVLRPTILTDMLPLGDVEPVDLTDRLYLATLQAKANAELNRRANRFNAAEQPSQLNPLLASQPAFPRRVCLNQTLKSAEIILSAGALRSPYILMMSGIGPREEVAKLDVPLKFHHPLIGRGLQDRPLIGLSVFLRENFMNFPAKICRTAGLHPLPPQDPFLASSFDIPVVPFEEIAGGSALFAVLVALRMIWPPEYRNTLAGDWSSWFLRECAKKDSNTLDPPRLATLKAIGCQALASLDPCLHKAAAWWTFLSHVHSRGFITIHPTEQTPIYQLNYLQDPRDLEQIRNNLRYLLNVSIVIPLQFISIFR